MTEDEAVAIMLLADAYAYRGTTQARTALLAAVSTLIIPVGDAQDSDFSTWEDSLKGDIK